MVWSGLNVSQSLHLLYMNRHICFRLIPPFSSHSSRSANATDPMTNLKAWHCIQTLFHLWRRPNISVACGAGAYWSQCSSRRRRGDGRRRRVSGSAEEADRDKINGSDRECTRQQEIQSKPINNILVRQPLPPPRPMTPLAPAADWGPLDYWPARVRRGWRPRLHNTALIWGPHSPLASICWTFVFQHVCEFV